MAGVWHALGILKALNLARNDVPIADTIRRLLDSVRAHAIFAFHHGGTRRLANLHRLAELARLAEISSRMSFREFVRWLDEESDDGQTPEAPVLEQSGGVKLMTLHKAKGLEFPIVILGDPSARLTSPFGPTRWVDTEHGLCAQTLMGCAPQELAEHREDEERADREEAVRNAYVAATRAKDLLVITALGDHENPEWWLAPFYDVIYPPPARRSIKTPAPGCPTFGTMTVLNQPFQAPTVQVRPGEHTPRVGTHRVVWFDPGILDLKESTPAGTDRIELLDGIPEQVKTGLKQYEDWANSKQARLAVVSHPSMRVERATEAGEYPEVAAVEVIVEAVKTGIRQPSGRTYGRLLHAVLQSNGFAEAHGRKLGATEDEVAAAEATARVVITHEVVAPGGREVFREAPVVVRMNDGTLVEGRIDLAFRDKNGWVVVDYKTGSADQQKAVRQLRLYAHALATATGLPARAVLLEIA
jgi:ATP-dependent exoDNAse (exonuclease V) beta subunit